MAPAVEAGSLANLIDLADNPPAQLPQHDRALPEAQKPLLLYIARVPGSRDIFLTTMKPQQKVVTAQDVQSSLYYLHVDGPDDYRLLRDEDSREDPSTELLPISSPALSDTASLPHKDIPSPKSANTPARPNLAELHHDTRTYGPRQNAPVARKPIGQGVKPGHRSLDAGPTFPSRQVLGPRPMSQSLHPVQITTLQSVPGRENIDMRRWSEHPPSLPPRQTTYNQKSVFRPSLEANTRDTVNRQRPSRDAQPSAEHCWDWERSWETRRASEAREEMAEIASSCQNFQESLEEHNGASQDVCLSLIRRYNGEQWNVARVTNTPNMNSRDATIHTEAETLMDILTAGYGKFVGSTDSYLQSRHGNSIDLAPKIDEEHRISFQRHLQFSRASRRPNHKHNPRSRGAIDDAQIKRSSFESRQQSFDSYRSSTIEPLGQSKASPKGYFIKSPWNGVCEFSTGIAGRSLKCKHSRISANPGSGPGVFSAPVSELRFNLPSSKTFGTPAAKSPEPGTPRESERSSLFLRSHHRRTSSTREGNTIQQTIPSGLKVELEDRLDLSLGQEHAGGGFGGKQAKLGKLIVEDEGLQMLDLVVATNMALWWKVYERVT